MPDGFLDKAHRAIAKNRAASGVSAGIGVRGSASTVAPVRAKPRARDADTVPAGFVRSPLTKLLYNEPKTEEEARFIKDVDARAAEVRKSAAAARRRSTSNTFTVPEANTSGGIGKHGTAHKETGILELEQIARKEKTEALGAHEIAGQIFSGASSQGNRNLYKNFLDYQAVLDEFKDRATNEAVKVGEKGGAPGKFLLGHGAGIVAGGLTGIPESGNQMTKYGGTGVNPFSGDTEDKFRSAMVPLGLLSFGPGRPAVEGAKSLIAGSKTLRPLVLGNAMRKSDQELPGLARPRAVYAGGEPRTAPRVETAFAKAGQVGNVAGRAVGRRGAASAPHELSTAERAAVHGSSTDKLQRDIDLVHEADVNRVPVSPRDIAVARLAREELAKRMEGQPAHVTTGETFMADAEATLSAASESGVPKTFSETVGFRQQTPVEAMLSTMRDMGLSEHKIAASKALLEPIYEIAIKNRHFPARMMLEMADKIDPTGKLKQAFAEPFYSKLERSLGKAPNKATGLQMKNTLLGQGVKAEELEYTGVGRFLDDNATQPVSKQDVVDLLAERKVEVREVMKGGLDKPRAIELDQEAIRLTRTVEDSMRAKGFSVDDRFDVVQRGGENSDAGRRVLASGDDDLIASARRMWDFNNARTDDLERAAGAVPTKFGQYTLPGGKNYRELLITLPEKGTRTVPKYKVAPRGRGFVIVDDGGATMSRVFDTAEEAQGGIASMEASVTRFGGGDIPSAANFTQSHWDEPNVLAHIRFDERVGPNGEKVLHVAEIQSDWHQKARDLRSQEIKRIAAARGIEKDTPEYKALQKEVPADFGYNREREPKVPPGWEVRRIAQSEVDDGLADAEDVGKWGLFDDSPGGGEILGIGPANQTQQQFLRDLAANNPEVAGDVLQTKGYPDAPFKTTWHELAMKRVLRYAAENDFDVVSWDAGATQADRYDLSKQVQSVDVTYLPDGKYKLSARPIEGGNTIGLGIKSADELPDVVGKELAQKIVDGGGTDKAKFKIIELGGGSHAVQDVVEGRTIGHGSLERMEDLAHRLNSESHPQTRSFSGLDLKVGGEGMKGFYDKILPDFANKYGKKWGASVESVGGDGAGAQNAETALGALAEGERRLPSPEGWTGGADLWNQRVAGEADRLRALMHFDGLSFDEAVEGMAGGDGRALAAVRNSIEGASGKYPVHQMRVTPEMKASVLNEGQPLFQQGGDGIQGTYDPVTGVMAFVKGRANLSTVFHEHGHFFHSVLLNDAEFGPVVREVYGDLDNVKGAEKFARHFEDYLRSGKAPNAKLQTVFDAVREWMRQIYARFTHGSAPKEIKAIFDKVYDDPSPETMRLVDEFNKLSLTEPEGVASFGDAVGFQRSFDDAVESFDPIDMKMAEAVQYRNARAFLMDRFSGTQTDDIAKMHPDDPRFDPMSDTYDYDLTKEAYRRAGGDMDEFDYTKPLPVIEKWLGPMREVDQMKWEDIDYLTESLAELKGKSGGLHASAEAKAMFAKSKGGNGAWWKDASEAEQRRIWFAVKKNKNGGWTIMPSPARVVSISHLPRPLQLRMVESARSVGGDVNYMHYADWKTYREKGVKPMIVNDRELVDHQGTLDDFELAQEGVHGETVVPGAAWDAVVKDLEDALKFQKELQREADPANLRKEVRAAQPGDAPPVPDERTVGVKQEDLNIERIAHQLGIVEKEGQATWAELVKDAVPSRWKEHVNKKGAWSASDNADALMALAKMAREDEDLLRQAIDAQAAGDKEALDRLGSALENNRADIDKLTEAMHRAGSGQGAALGSRRMMLDHDYTLAGAKARVAIAEEMSGKAAGAKAKSYMERLASEIEKAEADLGKAQAGRVIKKYQAGFGKTRRSVEDIARDIEAVKADYAKAKAQANAGAFSTVPVPAWARDAKAFEAFTRFLKLEVEAGASRLEDLVLSLKKHMASIGHDLSDSDIRRGIAGLDKPETGPVSKKEAQGLLIDLKREALLIEKITAAEAGEKVRPGRAKPRAAGAAPRVEELERQLADLQEKNRTTGRANREMELLSRREGKAALRAERMADRAQGIAMNRAARADLAATRKAARDAATAARREAAPALRDAAYQEKLQNQIADMEDMLASGEYFATKRIDRQASAEVEALRSKRDILRKKLDVAIDDISTTRRQKVGRAVLQVAQNVRGFQLGADLGNLTRQGLFSITNPIAYIKGVGAGGRAAFSEAAAMTIERGLDERVVGGRVMRIVEKDAGLSRTSSFGHLNEMEELVMANIVKRIPFIGKTVGGSLERVQHAFINTVRAETFDQAVRAGFTPEELALRAKFINNATGRGNFDKVAPLAQAMFTSPRYEASRWSMLGEPFRAAGHLAADAAVGKLNKAALYNLRDLGTTAGLVYGTFKVAELAGYTVDWDPTSSDFLKMRKGDEVWDVSAGLAPRLRDAVRLLVLWGEPEKFKAMTDVLGKSFVRTLSPGIKTPIEQSSAAYQKSKGVENPVSPFSGFETEEDERGWIAFAPLIVQSAKKTLKEEGPLAAAGTVVKEGLGTSVNRYAKPKPFKGDKPK